MNSLSLRHRGSAALAVVVMLVVAGCTSDDAATDAPRVLPVAPETWVTPVIGSVLYAPAPFLGSDGKRHLVYELLVTNYTGGPATIDRLHVLDAVSGAGIATLDAAELGQRVRPTGGQQFSTRLAGGQNGAVFLHLTFDADAEIPNQLVHELEVTVESAPPDRARETERIGQITVDRRTLPVLSPPLVGKGYIAADACCDAVRHTRALLPINGQPFLAQRYAIDYEQVDGGGRIYTGEKSDLSSYVIYGDEALAVADGTVVGTLDGLAQQTPGAYPENIPITEADGNSVVLDIGNGFYVNYAHLQPETLRVNVGDRVRKGDVLGLVGNSGNSIAPHLHIHLMDTPSPLASQGLPYLIDAFTVTGKVTSTAAFDASESDGIPLVTVPDLQPTEHKDQLVLDQNIVTYGAGSG